MSHWIHWCSVGDNHGSEVDPVARKAFFKFVDDFKPKLRVHHGDNFDLRPMRRKATEDEKREGISLDFQRGMEFLEEYKPSVFLMGNHDHRLVDYRDRQVGLISEYSGKCVEHLEKTLKKFYCDLKPYNNRDGFYDLGNLRIMHGFGSGLYAARRMALAYGSLVMGHLHVRDMLSIEGHHRRCAWVAGCLCRLDMEYAQTQIASLRWQHSWSYGQYHTKTGEYQVYLAERIGDKFYYPTEFREI